MLANISSGYACIFLIWKVNAYIINYTLYDAGITMNDVNPDYVIVGEGKAYSLDTLTKAVNLVLAAQN